MGDHDDHADGFQAAAFSLLDALAETGFHASVIATYCCYFPFYEEIILRRLVDKGCGRNILLVDAVMCAQAFASEHTRPRRAGRDYTLIPVDLHGAFHPKLIVAIGKAKGALFVGSHNATLAGFGLNDEVTNQFRTSGAGARQGAGVIRGALDYLQAFVPAALPDVAQAFSAVRRNIPWLEGPAAVDSNERILLTTTGEDADLWSRIRPLVPTRPALAFLCGPFFDGSLSFLRRVADDVKPRRMVVGIDPDSVEIDPDAVRALRGAEFVNIAGCAPVPNRRDSDSRYLHAKILWFSGSSGELLVTGSANPSRAAFLTGPHRRNAEAIVADRRPGVATLLGLEHLVAAPAVDAAAWASVAARQADRAHEPKDAALGRVILAVPSNDGFTLERPLTVPAAFDAFAADGTLLGQAVVRVDDLSQLDAPSDVREQAQTFRALDAAKPLDVLVHRPDDIARSAGGDHQRELRQALGALEEDPAQLDTLLKLTHKVIFESEDIVNVESGIRPRTTTASRESTGTDTGPESLAVEAAGRRASRKVRRLASGEMLVLLDVLMHRLGEGLASAAPLRPPPDEVRPVAEDDDGGEDPASVASLPYEQLAEACRRKVGRLVRRMLKQLEAARAGSARRAVVQLAAVLSVVQALCRIAQRPEWRSRRLRLVEPAHVWELLEGASVDMTWGPSSLAPRALAEGDGESFQELSLAIGLLAWSAWYVEIDVRSAVKIDQELPNPLDLDDPRWYPLQLFAAVAVPLAADQDARQTFEAAVHQTARKGVDAAAWLNAHLSLAEWLAQVTAMPDDVTALDGAPRPGDLIILRATLVPRIRLALEVVPSRTSYKVIVFAPEHPDGVRQFLITHVRHASLWGMPPAKSRPASA